MAKNIYIAGPKMIMDGKSIAEMFMDQLNTNKGLYGIDCSTGNEYSYSKLKTDVRTMAAVLQNENFGPGDIVMTTDYGSYEGQVVLLAGLLVGATISALDYNLRTDVLASLLNESKPDVIFCSESSVGTITSVLKTIAHRPTLKISTFAHDDFTAYSNCVTSNDSFEYSAKLLSKNRPCALVFSSGTTGVPKGIYLSDDALKSASITFKSIMGDPVEKRFMITSPIFWYTGILLLVLGIHFGRPRLFFSSKPNAEKILDSIDRFKPTFLMTGVAAIVEMTSYQMANGHKYSVSSLITIVVGGSPMRPELQKSVTENLLFGRIPIKQGYGSTEQGIIAHWSVDADTNTVKDGSVGRPGAGIEIKIVSLETGECVGADEEGEIRIKSVSNMMGYANDMKKTVNAYDEDGWFKSGDVGYYTRDCCLYIVGRIKELLIYKDFRIAPTDVETILLSHPAVLDAGVTSKDGLHGDLLVGVVKVKPGHDVEPDELVSYVDGNAKDHERLRGGLIFVDEVPRSPAGKIKREELKLLAK